MFNKPKYPKRSLGERTHCVGISQAGALASHRSDTVQAVCLIEYNIYLGTLSNEREMLSEADHILHISVTAHLSQT